MAGDIKKRKPRDVVFETDLRIEWRDGAIARYPFFALRDSCPCASCINEITGEKILDPKTIDPNIHITRAAYTGNYALRIVWSDGHDTGIYSFKTLREYFDSSLEQGSPEGSPFQETN